jgi:sulfate permease, SulP family
LDADSDRVLADLLAGSGPDGGVSSNAGGVKKRRMRLPGWPDLRRDALAGIPAAIGSVPDGMASSVLVGVSPIHGLYASFAGPLFGGMASSTQLMVIATTSASALAAGSALGGISAQDRPGALALLTLLGGLVMIASAALRLGRFTRFVSHSVMIGFLTGVAANIVFNQLPDLTGTTASGAFPLAKAANVIRHPLAINLAALACGLGAIALTLGLSRFRPLAPYAAVGALLAPSVVVGLAGLHVSRVVDLGPIPSGLPIPAIPDLTKFSFGLLSGALAVAAIVLVQGAGVSESAPNRDHTYSDANRDFLAQGLGNVASGIFKGQPVGGSVGQTALNIAAGARTRWAAVLSGLWMLVILVLLSGVIGKVALPTLAGLLIYAAVRSLQLAQAASILRAGATSVVAIIATFIGTLFLPVAAAVGIGVAISLLLQLNREALDLSVVEVVPRDDGRLEERAVPAHLESHHVTMLQAYGSLLYAGSRTLQARLPDPSGTESPAVVLRLRGRTAVGATFSRVVGDYARRLQAVGGRLYLAGLDPRLKQMLDRTSAEQLPNVEMIEGTPVLRESSLAAYEAASRWVKP